MGRISMPQGKGSQLHNRREYEKIGREIPDNINAELSAENVTLVDMNIREAYAEIFGEALEKYNAKQRRADRKIEDYYDHISKSKNGEKLFYEDVLQWGKKEDFEAHPELKEVAKECLIAYVQGFQERNPNLRLIGAYIHMDEASPHLHLDYVPVAHGTAQWSVDEDGERQLSLSPFNRGLSARNSLDKAMKEMGFIPENESRQNNATKLWKEHEREVFADICRTRGLEVEAERKARGSLSVEEYKEAKEEMLSDILSEKDSLEVELARDKAESEFLKKKSEKLSTQIDSLDQDIIARTQEVNAIMSISSALQDDSRTEPIQIHTNKGTKDYVPLPELQRRHKRLEKENEVLESEASSLQADISQYTLEKEAILAQTSQEANRMIEEAEKYKEEQLKAQFKLEDYITQDEIRQMMSDTHINQLVEIVKDATIDELCIKGYISEENRQYAKDSVVIQTRVLSKVKHMVQELFEKMKESIHERLHEVVRGRGR